MKTSRNAILNGSLIVAGAALGSMAAAQGIASAPGAALHALLPTLSAQTGSKVGEQVKTGNFQINPGATFIRSVPVEFSLNSMRYRDQDDFVGDDEPYMMNISFRAKLIVDGLGNAKADPASITVAPIGTAIQNNLGRSGDGWADSGKSYDIRAGNQKFSTMLPDQAGWFAGMFCTFWEEDNFSATQCRLTRDELVRQVRRAITSMNMTGLNDKTFSQGVGIRLVNDVRASIRLGDFSTFLKGIASTVNPDDFGGVNIIIASAFGNNSIKAFAGPASATGSFVNMVELPKPGTGGNQVYNVAINFPAGTVPGNFFAKFEGDVSVSGTVRRS
jgi:hypothetical protein